MQRLKISTAVAALSAVMFIGGGACATPLSVGAVELASQAQEQSLAIPVEVRRASAPRTFSRSVVRTPRIVNRSAFRASPISGRRFVGPTRFTPRGRIGTTVIIGAGTAWPYYDPYYAPYYEPYVYYDDVPGDDAIAYCISRFKSYDIRTMTYLGFDGLRHPCP